MHKRSHTLPTLVEQPDSGGPIEFASTCVADRYELLSCIGVGGMGVVYRASDKLTGKVLALKQIRQPSGNDVGALQVRRLGRRLSLAREFRILAGLRHPNIISVLDYGFTDTGDPFYTMELLACPTTIVDKGLGRSTAEKVLYLVQLLRALAYLHRRGIVHRDLKPSNVLVDNQVRLVDFGISSFKTDKVTSGGTNTYIAPEVLRGETAGAAADLYAVGVIASDLFFGAHSLPSASRSGVKDRGAQAQSSTGELRGIEKMRTVIRRCLVEDPAERYASADELSNAFSDAAALPRRLETRASRNSFLIAAEFVDRVCERDQLYEAVNRLGEGGTSLWLISGESGTGKSRLVDEVRTFALVHGVRVVEGQARRDASEGYQLWREPARHLLLGVPPQSAAQEVLAEIFPGACAKLDGGAVSPPAQPLRDQNVLAQAIGTLLQAQEPPVLLILEDLHWGGDSLEVLGQLAPTLTQHKVMLVATYRPEEGPSVPLVLPAAKKLTLGPLPKSDVATLLDSMIGAGTGRSPIVEFLHRHTEGHVLFVVEAVRALAENAGSLAQIERAALPERLVAAGIEAVVARRVGMVPSAMRRLVDLSAIIGRSLELEVLRFVFGADLVASMLDVVGGDLALFDVRGDQWRFAHDRYREHCVNTLEPGRTQDLHAQAALALEQVHGSGKEEAARLAHHYREAGLPKKELPYALLAGQTALERGSYAQAEVLLKRALVLSETLQERNSELQLLLLYRAVLAATKTWSAPEYMETENRLVTLTRKLDAQQKTVPALHGQAMALAYSGDLERARVLSLQYASLDQGECRLQASVVLSNVAKWRGEHSQVAKFHEDVMTLFKPDLLGHYIQSYGWNPRAVADFLLAVSSCIGGDIKGNLTASSRALKRAEDNEHPFALGMALQSCAWVNQVSRQVPETMQWAQALSRLGRDHGFPMFQMQGALFAAWARAHSADRNHGLEELRTMMAPLLDKGEMCISYYSILLVDAELVAGHWKQALELSGRVLGSTRLQERCYHAEHLRLQAVAKRKGGDDTSAKAILENSRLLAQSQGARLFELRALVDAINLEGQRPIYLSRIRALNLDLQGTPDGQNLAKALGGNT